MQNKVIVDFLSFWLLFGKKPWNHVIQRFQVIHDKRIFLVNCNSLIEKLLKYVSCYLHDVLWVHMRSILKTANDKQEDISSFLCHFYPIDVTATNIKKASHIFKNFNENEPEFFQRKLNTRSIIYDAFTQWRRCIVLPLLQLRLSRCAHFQYRIQVTDWRVYDINLVPDHIIVNVFVQLGRCVDEKLNFFPHVTQNHVMRET
jgi:hypothetical protein